MTLNKAQGRMFQSVGWTWNPIAGCTHGCPYCYARSRMKRWGKTFEPVLREHFFKDKMPNDGSWIFVGSMGDVFCKGVPDEWILMLLEFIKEDESYEGYQEFVGKTGIDPQSDIFSVAIAVTKGMEKPHQEGVGIINLKYNKDDLITIIKNNKKEEQELTEEEYNGVTIYTIKEEDGEKSFSFLDKSNIVLGNENEVKSVIDVIQKKKENIFKNEELSAVLTKTNKDAMLWGAVLVPPEVSSKISAEKPMLSALEAVNGVAIYFDYKDKNIIADIKLMSRDTMKDQEL